MASGAKSLIGVSLMCLVVSGYSYLYTSKIGTGDLAYIQGTLAADPTYHQHGGEFNYYYLAFKTNEYPSEFYIKNCGYKSVDFESLARIKSGDSLSIGFLKESESKLKVEREIDVITLSSLKNDIVPLNNYNRCNQQNWKKPFYLAMIFLIGLTLYAYWKSIKLFVKDYFKIEE